MPSIPDYLIIVFWFASGILMLVWNLYTNMGMIFFEPIFVNSFQCATDSEQVTWLTPCLSTPQTSNPSETAQKSTATLPSSTRRFTGKLRTFTDLYEFSISTLIDWRPLLSLCAEIHTPEHRRWTLPSLTCSRPWKKLLVRLCIKHQLSTKHLTVSI